jgi:hypothetical protein
MPFADAGNRLPRLPQETCLLVGEDVLRVHDEGARSELLKEVFCGEPEIDAVGHSEHDAVRAFQRGGETPVDLDGRSLDPGHNVRVVDLRMCSFLEQRVD